MTATTKRQEDLKSIRDIFSRHLSMKAEQPSEREIEELASAIDMIRHSPIDITYAGTGSPYKEFCSAVSTLQRVLPGLIEEFAKRDREAKSVGRNSDAGHFVLKATDMSRALEPFTWTANKRRDARSYWHSAASFLRLITLPLIDSNGRGFSGPETIGTRIVADLLDLTGILKEPVTPDSVVKALLPAKGGR